MTKPIAITLTRKEEIRNRRPDDVRRHRIWSGTEWVSFAPSIISPRLAADCGVKDGLVISTRLKFPPPGVVTKDALVYRRTLMREMQKQGVIR